MKVNNNYLLKKHVNAKHPESNLQPDSPTKLQATENAVVTEVKLEIPAEDIRRGNFSKSEFEQFFERTKSLSEAPIYIDDTPALSIFELRAKTPGPYRVQNIKKKYKETFAEKHGVSLGFMSFFTKAVVRALQMYPDVNSMIDGDYKIAYDYCDISVAVSGPKGLMVPVVRGAENLSFRAIEQEIKRLAIRARDGQITLDDMTGGTFTISNGGVFGSMLSTPIINPPQSGILGMHNIIERPVAIEGKVEIRPMMYLALSYDHRLVDGKDAVQFLVAIKNMIEDPARVLLEI